MAAEHKTEYIFPENKKKRFGRRKVVELSSPVLTLPSGRRIKVVYNSTVDPATTHMLYHIYDGAILFGHMARENVWDARRGKSHADETVKSGLKHEYQHAIVHDEFIMFPHLPQILQNTVESYPVNTSWDNFKDKLLSIPEYNKTLIGENGKVYIPGILHELFAYYSESEPPNTPHYNIDVIQAAAAVFQEMKIHAPQLYLDLKGRGILANQDFERDYPTLRAEMEKLIAKEPVLRRLEGLVDKMDKGILRAGAVLQRLR